MASLHGPSGMQVSAPIVRVHCNFFFISFPFVGLAPKSNTIAWVVAQSLFENSSLEACLG